jgi:hypothetical protein
MFLYFISFIALRFSKYFFRHQTVNFVVIHVFSILLSRGKVTAGTKFLSILVKEFWTYLVFLIVNAYFFSLKSFIMNTWDCIFWIV